MMYESEGNNQSKEISNSSVDMNTDADKISNEFVKLLSTPVISSAHFVIENEHVLQIAVNWGATDVAKKDKTNFAKVYTILKNSIKSSNSGDKNTGCLEVYESSPIILNGDFTCVSKSGSRKAVVSKNKSESKEEEFLQIFDKETLFKTYNLKELDKHGGIYTSPFWGSTMSFNDDGTKLMYLAEAKIKKTVPFFTSYGKGSGLNENINSTSNTAKGEEFAYRQSWGEKMSEYFQSVLVVLDTEKDTFHLLDLPDNISPSDLQWVNNSTIVGVGYSNVSSKLGIVFCTNRNSRIFQVNTDGSNFNYLSELGKAAFSPRVRPQGNFVIWQERKIDAPHLRANKIIGLSLAQGELPYVIYESNPPNFIPIYEDFPQNCWTMDGRKFFTTTHNDIETFLLSFQIGEENILVNPKLLKGIANIFCIGENFIVACKSSKIETVSILLLDISDELIKTFEVTAGRRIVESEMKRLLINGREPPSSFYYGPSGNNILDHSVPLVVMVHGGPHVCYLDQFGPESSLLLKLGFGVLFVNYFGSTGGKTDDAIDGLCGRIGKDDLIDCQMITQSLLDQEKSLDSTNIFVFGGSHGGFLGAHLMSSYPDFYKAAVLLNPVTDLTAMVSSTDIPDWCYAESGAGVEYSGNNFLPYVQNLEDAKKFMNCSPILNASKVKGAILLLLGTQDLRVPISQGLAYYRALKFFNKETEVRVYNDNHSLYKVPCRFDVMVHSILWFYSHLKK